MSVIAEAKRCSRCRLWKPAERFHRQCSKPDGLQSRCKDCLAELQREYRKKRPSAYWNNKDKKYALKKRYGLSLTDFQALRDKQGGVCAICRKDPRTMGKDTKHQILHVDHDHMTKQVRGLLCNGCNRAIGLINDNIDTAKSLVAYLETCMALGERKRREGHTPDATDNG